MAGKQIAGEAFTSNFAGMSKNQLYDIMSQMKTLIEQNQPQARQVLVQNPPLTRALFQAQIMLGMVQPPQVMPNIQQALSQPPQQAPQPNQPLPVQVGPQDQGSAPITQNTTRKQQPNQPVLSIPSASVPQLTLQSQTMQSHSLQSLQQSKGHLNVQGSGTSMTLPQSSQIHNIPPPLHSAPQPSSLQSQVPLVSSQSQHSGIPHMPLQPPLPPQPRPPSMQPFQHQLHSQMGLHLGFQSSGPSQSHLLQPPFSSGTKAQGSIGSSFPQGQPPMPSQPPPQSLYQVGSSHLGSDFNSQAGGSMQVERGSWMPGLPDNATGVVSQLPGPPPLPGSSHSTRPPQLSPEMEKALLQQVMSLTPEQINLLPPEQRNQVLQLQQMLR